MSFVTCSIHFLFLILLLILPIFAFAQTYSNVTLGSSLTANISSNASWLSPSGEFAFGFRLVEDNRFLLAIWFDKIYDKTIVWYAYANATNAANGTEPTVPRGSKVELTTEGRLVLKDPGDTVLWNPEPVTGEVSYAAMLDTGNFVLAKGNSEDYSWESFKQPTDTILPTQTLKVRMNNNKLYSRQTRTTYAKGRFRLRFLDEGNLVLNTVGFPSISETNYDSYYNLTKERSTRISGKQLLFNKLGSIYIVTKNDTKVELTWPSNNIQTAEVYYRATLDFDGVFTQYSHPKTFNSSQPQRWSPVRSIPENICHDIQGILGTGACGYNSYCILFGSSRRPTCKCPPGYVFLDPNNTYGGCRPNFVLQGCQDADSRNPENLFELQTLRNVDWPTTDYERLDAYSEQDCRMSCLNDCQCAVALQRQDGQCWKKKLPLPNGRLEPSVAGITLIKVRKVQGFSPQHCSHAPNSSPKNKDRPILILVGSLLGSSAFFNFMFLVAIFLVFLFMDKKLRKTNSHRSTVLRSNLRSFTYKELEEATGGFKEELGRGAFGIVYKGVTEEMGLRNYVAVKKLDKVFREGEKEFKTEVNVIGQTHHKNLVRLLGFCEEGQNRLLVYEFMSNSSLAEHLFGISKPDWNQRVQIAFGISRGLMYLHEECSTQIIHCDIKPQNILLDDSFAARISDFGLAKLLMTNQTRTSTGIRGTKGYVAPEWFRNTAVTVKVDVYSFGVMLLEIICCRKSVELEFGENVKAVLTDWAYDCYSKDKLHDLVMNDEDVKNDMRRVERLVMIAIWCVQEDPSLRPTMKKVTQMLEGVLEVSVPPCPYSFTFMGDPTNETSN